ncbi:MAG: anti-sigma factor [Ignavibacteriaceae bacterium]|jgi:hypothetical protein
MATGSGQDFATLLHAFALGCLEREEYDLMMEYFKSNQDYPWQELGEYQNLVALLPSFLNIESPDARVKDMVARKLYRLRDQQRPQRTTQIISQTSPLQHKNLFQRIETDEQKLFSQISSPLSPEEMAEPEPTSAREPFEPATANVSRTMDFEPVSSEKENSLYEPEKNVPDTEDYSSPFKSDETSKEEDPYSSYSSYSAETTDSSFSSNFDNIESGSKETSESKDDFSFESSLSDYSLSKESSSKTDEDYSSFTSETIIDEPSAEEPKEAPEVQQVKSGVSKVIFSLTFILLAGTIGAVYYFLSKDFKTATEKQTAKYESIVQSLKTEVSSTKQVDELLASINLQMVTLKSTPKAAGAYGKVLFDSVTRKAMLQVVNLPVLSSDKAYQLWIISNGQEYSAGLYEVTSSRQYFPVTNFGGLSLTGQTSFLITEEILSGGEKPSKDVYLAGQIVF